MKTNKKLIIVICIIIGLVLIGYSFWQNKAESDFQLTTQPVVNNTAVQNKVVAKPADPAAVILVSEPISGALARVTKKPFGIKISPKDSPVSPERFSGYHTGVDFETTLSEQKTDVSIMAVCDGNLIYKNWVNGYGGVVIESCKIDKQEVTIIYGHLRLASISQKTGGKLVAGKSFAVLGKGFSTETNGERKHLHLGIHLGSKINFLGYAQVKSDLINWLDITKYLAK